MKNQEVTNNEAQNNQPNHHGSAHNARPVSFTPGPWETSRDAVPEGHVQITVYAESSGERVATVFQAEANARLIAAAPAMYEALKNLLANPGPRENRRDAVAALALVEAH